MKRCGWVLASVLALAACNGGGGNPGECFGSAEVCGGVQPGGPPPAAGGPTGVYVGTTGTGRVFHAVVRTNDLWFLYSQLGNGALLAGAEQGTYVVSTGSIASNDIADFTSEAQGVARGVLSGNIVPQVSLAGTVTLPDRSFSFSTTYDSDSATSPALGAAAGTYTGVAVFAGDQVTANATVTNEGVISGQTVAGCNFSGNMIPDAGIASYTLTLTFVGGPCPTNLSSASGVAIVEGTRLRAATINAGKTEGFAFSGGR